jgi:hypothetical protein
VTQGEQPGHVASKAPVKEALATWSFSATDKLVARFAATAIDKALKKKEEAAAMLKDMVRR